MSDHSDAEFAAQYGFCRIDCDECARLDREALAGGTTLAEIMAQATAMVTAALAAGEAPLPTPPQRVRE